jgi:hypothetical protein
MAQVEQAMIAAAYRKSSRKPLEAAPDARHREDDILS